MCGGRGSGGRWETIVPPQFIQGRGGAPEGEKADAPLCAAVVVQGEDLMTAYAKFIILHKGYFKIS